MLEGDMARRLWNAVDEEHAGKALRPIIPHRALSEARLSDEGWPILPTNPLQPAVWSEGAVARVVPPKLKKS